MKKIFLVFFSLFSMISFSQKINDYEFVMVPMRFNFQSMENEYRLNTLLKFRLEEYGFKAFYTGQQLNTRYEDRCQYLNVDVVNNNGFLNTKLYIVFKDCNGNIVFQSSTGMSKDKDYKTAYIEALEIALVSVKNLNYKFQGAKAVEKPQVETEKVVLKTETVNENALFAQPITNGFQLVDKTPKVILKMFKTSKADFFIAVAENKNGTVFKFNDGWVFEYYVEGNLISEKFIVKF